MSDHLAEHHVSEDIAKPAERRHSIPESGSRSASGPAAPEPGTASGSVPGSVSGSEPVSVPGSEHDPVPVSAPTSAPGSVSGPLPTLAPTSVPGTAPDSLPSSAPGSVKDSVPTSAPGSAPCSAPGSAPTSAPTSAPGSGPGSGSVTRSGSGTRPGSAGSRDHQQEGYGVVTAGVFLTSASVGANLLNVPQGMAHLGWLGLPIMAVLGIQSWFCSHLLASSWMLVQSLDPALSGAVHQPYPLMAHIAFGPWARHMISLAVLSVDTLTSVMLLVLASDLVASIVSYAFPPAQPTVCLLILLMATFLCPFTWFESPKNFWMVAVLGLSTSVSAWLLLLMKMCTDYSQRAAPPVRAPPSPLRMMVGMSGIANCFATAGVQPTIQADMKDRAAFSSALAAVFLAISLMVSSTAATSYTLIGSETKSSVLHNLGPDRLLLAIQGLMLLHVLTSFVIYINPLYQEVEELLNIPEGTWRQYTFRTLCMVLLVLFSEALPDFSSTLDLVSILAILITMAVPPIMYLRLAGRADVDVKLNIAEKTLLMFLVVTGLVYCMVTAFGATSFVFVEQQQGSCFQFRSQRSSNVKTMPATTPASRAIIFKAQILTFKPPVS